MQFAEQRAWKDVFPSRAVVGALPRVRRHERGEVRRRLCEAQAAWFSIGREIIRERHARAERDLADLPHCKGIYRVCVSCVEQAEMFRSSRVC